MKPNTKKRSKNKKRPVMVKPIKCYTMEEVLTKYYGKVGTKKRDASEKQINKLAGLIPDNSRKSISELQKEIKQLKSRNKKLKEALDNKQEQLECFEGLLESVQKIKSIKRTDIN